jgi:hypothetical protein
MRVLDVPMLLVLVLVLLLVEALKVGCKMSLFLLFRCPVSPVHP